MFNHLLAAFQQQKTVLVTMVYEAIEKWAALTPEEYQAKMDGLSPLARSAMLSTARELRESDTKNQEGLDRLIGALE